MGFRLGESVSIAEGGYGRGWGRDLAGVWQSARGWDRADAYAHAYINTYSDYHRHAFAYCHPNAAHIFAHIHTYGYQYRHTLAICYSSAAHSDAHAHAYTHTQTT